MTVHEEHTLLRENLNARINYLRSKALDDQRVQSLCNSMYTAVHYAGSLRLLRIYNDHLLDQEDLTQLQALVSSARYFVNAHVVNSHSDFTEDHRNRLLEIDEELHRVRDELPARSPISSAYVGHLETIRAVAVLSDEATFEYLRDNVVQLSALLMNSKATAPRVVLEALKVAAANSRELVSKHS